MFLPILNIFHKHSKECIVYESRSVRTDFNLYKESISIKNGVIYK